MTGISIPSPWTGPAVSDVGAGLTVNTTGTISATGGGGGTLNVYGYDGGSVTNVTGLTFEGVAVTGTSPDALINMTTVTGTVGQGISLAAGPGVSGAGGGKIEVFSGYDPGNHGGSSVLYGGNGTYGGTIGLIGGSSSGTAVSGGGIYLIGGGGSTQGVIHATPLINVNSATGAQSPGDVNITGNFRQNGTIIGPLDVLGTTGYVDTVTNLTFNGVTVGGSSPYARIDMTAINAPLNQGVQLTAGADAQGAGGARVFVNPGFAYGGGTMAIYGGRGAATGGNGADVLVVGGAGYGAGFKGGDVRISANQANGGANQGSVFVFPGLNVNPASGTATAGQVNAQSFAINGTPFTPGIEVYTYAGTGGNVFGVTNLGIRGAVVSGSAPFGLIDLTSISASSSGTIGGGVTLQAGSASTYDTTGAELYLGGGSTIPGFAAVVGGRGNPAGGNGGAIAMLGGAGYGPGSVGGPLYLNGGAGDTSALQGVVNVSPILNIGAATGTQNPGDINISGAVRQNGVPIGPFSVASGTLTVSPVTQLYIIGGTLTDMGGGVAQLAFP